MIYSGETLYWIVSSLFITEEIVQISVFALFCWWTANTQHKFDRHQLQYLRELGNGWFGKVTYALMFCRSSSICVFCIWRIVEGWICEVCVNSSWLCVMKVNVHSDRVVWLGSISFETQRFHFLLRCYIIYVIGIQRIVLLSTLQIW